MKKLSFVGKKKSRPGFNERICLLKWNIVHWNVLTASDSRKPWYFRMKYIILTPPIYLYWWKGISFWKTMLLIEIITATRYTYRIFLSLVIVVLRLFDTTVILCANLYLHKFDTTLMLLLPGNSLAFFCCMTQSVTNYQECDEEKSSLFYSFFPLLS